MRCVRGWRIYLAAICSHDCDVENSDARTGLLLVPLIKVPASADSQQYQNIMSSVHRTSAGECDFIHLFPFELDAVADVSHAVAVAHFISIISAARASKIKRELLEAQSETDLSENLRSACREKVGAFFGRPCQSARASRDSSTP